MIEVTASLSGYGQDVAEVDDPEAAVFAGRTLAADIREFTRQSSPDFNQLIRCDFKVDNKHVGTAWL